MKGLSQNKKCPLCSSVLCFFLLSIMEMDCLAQDIQNLDPPGNLEYLVDKINLIHPEHAQKIRDLGKRLLENTETPIIVVTIDKISDHVDEDISIDDFAERLFDQWQIGSSGNDGNEENLSKGVLLLFSNESGEARIILGAGWFQEKRDYCQWVYDSVIAPRFRASKYSRGIFAGFDILLRSMDIVEIESEHGRPNFGPKGNFSPPFILAIVLGLWTLISVWSSGSGGLAWRFWAKIFSYLTTFGK
ncbi:MAG TPA: TPM domain-containing protein [Verrucomicrobia bacterium]|nr:TPM domain-containing protein [Verrucomicrobiales bacterium]HIL55493.1 TPM domain-containing protein [Verrucomicrobiota bacterium]